MKINENLFVFLVLVSATTQCFVEIQLGVVCALVVPILLHQSFISLLVRLHSSGSIRVHERDPLGTPYASQNYNCDRVRRRGNTFCWLLVNKRGLGIPFEL